MNVLLTIEKTDEPAFVFRLIFINDSKTAHILPVANIKNSGDWLGMQIIHEGPPLEPIEEKHFNLIDATKDDVKINAGETFEIDFIAEICKIQDKYWGLKFANATFHVNPELLYDVFFHWKNYRSNSIRWKFSTPV